VGKFLKIFFSLLILVIIGLAAIPFIVDPNDYKDKITAEVEKHTGRQLQIEGDLKLSVFPWIGLETGKIVLGNAKGFDSKPFSVIDSAAIRIKLMPLLSSEVVADTITLDGLQLNLAKNKQGITNWADLSSGNAEKAKATESSTDKTASKGLAALAIGGISINNATINWEDAQTGESYQVKDFNLDTGSILPGSPVDIDLGMQLNSSQPAMQANLDLNGTVNLALDMSTLEISPFKLTIDANGDSLPNGKLNLSLSSRIAVNLKELAANIEELELKSGALQLTGSLNAEQLQSSPVISGEVSIAQMNLQKYLQDLGITLPEMADANALQQFAVSAKLDSADNVHKLSNLKIRLDSSNINGSLTQAGAHTDFKLDIDQINLDNYMPPASTTAADSAQPEQNAKPALTTPASASQKSVSSTAEAPLLPVELIRSLDLKGEAAIGQLIVKKLKAEQVKAAINAKNGKLNLNSSIGAFYQGSFTNNTTINVAGKTPIMATDASLKNMQAGPLLMDLTGKDQVTGNGNFSANLTTTGNTLSAIKKSLNGKLDLALKDGAVKGVNLAQMIRDTKARFEGKAVTQTNEPEQTDFSEMTASATIKNGILNNQDLLAKSPFIRVTGAGTVNLPAETLDYLVNASVVETSKGQGGKELDDLKGLNIPVKLTGSLMAPKYDIDWGKVLLSSPKVEEKLNEKLEEKLGPGAGSLLKGLFK